MQPPVERLNFHTKEKCIPCPRQPQTLIGAPVIKREIHFKD